MSIIEELYFGMINPAFDGYANGENAWPATNERDRAIEQLLKLLSADELKLFRTMELAQSEILGIITAECFAQGFRVGTRLMTDVYEGA